MNKLEHTEPYDLLLDFEDAHLGHLSTDQKNVFMEAAEQIAAYQCHPDTQYAIARLALMELGACAMPVVYLSVVRDPGLRSVVNQ